MENRSTSEARPPAWVRGRIAFCERKIQRLKRQLVRQVASSANQAKNRADLAKTEQRLEGLRALLAEMESAQANAFREKHE